MENCVACLLPMGEKGPAKYAAFSGLPSPCCEHCFESMDYTCDTIDQVVEKSIERRKRLNAPPFDGEAAS